MPHPIGWSIFVWNQLDVLSGLAAEPVEPGHEHHRHHTDGRAQNEDGGKAAACCGSGDFTKQHGRNGNGDHHQTIVGAGVLGAEQFGGDHRVDAGGAAVGKGHQEDCRHSKR